jgi:hypothetical protein
MEFQVCPARSRLFHLVTYKFFPANLLDDAYATLDLVDTKVDELGQELEYHHERLGKPIEIDNGEE